MIRNIGKRIKISFEINFSINIRIEYLKRVSRQYLPCCRLSFDPDIKTLSGPIEFIATNLIGITNPVPDSNFPPKTLKAIE